MRLLIDDSIPPLPLMEVKISGMSPLGTMMDISIMPTHTNQGMTLLQIVGHVSDRKTPVRMMVSLGDIAAYVAANYQDPAVNGCLGRKGGA